MPGSEPLCDRAPAQELETASALRTRRAKVATSLRVRSTRSASTVAIVSLTDLSISLHSRLGFRGVARKSVSRLPRGSSIGSCCCGSRQEARRLHSVQTWFHTVSNSDLFHELRHKVGQIRFEDGSLFCNDSNANGLLLPTGLNVTPVQLRSGRLTSSEDIFSLHSLTFVLGHFLVCSGIHPYNLPSCLISLRNVHGASSKHYRSCSCVCSNTSLKSDSICHSPCMPSCFSFSASVRTALSHVLLMAKRSHIPRKNCLMPTTYAAFIRKLILWTAPSHGVAMAASWKNLKPCSLHFLSHTCRAHRRSLTALGTMPISSNSSCPASPHIRRFEA